MAEKIESERLLAALARSMPLRIDEATLSGSVLKVSGQSWSCLIMCGWRLRNGDSYILGDCDFECLGDINLTGAVITDVKFQTCELPWDPAFQLGDGRTLELFSNLGVEPWVLKLPDGTIWTGLNDSKEDIVPWRGE